MAEIVPKTARNWRKERFRKYMRPFPYSVNPEPIGKAISPQRRRDAEVSAENALQDSCSLRLSLRLCVSAGNGILPSPCALFSRDASHADQVAEDDAFQGLRGGDAGVAAPAAHRHG